MDWNKIRQDFPVAENVTYFQSAGMSPLPNAVLRKIMEEYRKLNQFGDIFWMKDKGEVDELRTSIAAHINTSGENIAFVGSNSLAMSVFGLALKNKIKRPFNIVSMQEEFPSNSVPLEYLGIEMKYVQPLDHRYSVNDIIARINPGTIAVVTSYVQFATGFRQDLQSLGAELKKRNILFVVNATQGFPFYPIDVAGMNIDVLTCSMHKWGFAGHVGTLVYTSPEYRAAYPSPIAGWLSVQPSGSDFIHNEKNVPFNIYNDASQYIYGTFNLQNMLALKTAFDYIKSLGFENIRERISELGNYLVSKINTLPLKVISPLERDSERSAIVSFELNDFPNEECVDYLEKHGVYVSLRNGHVRVSLNIFNNEKDIDKLCEVLTLYINTRE